MYTAEQQALLDLQAIDSEGKSYTRAYLSHDAHKKLHELKKIEEQLNAQLEAIEGKLHSLDTRITAEKDELDASEAKVAGEKAKLQILTDPRMTQIVIKSIDALSRRIDKLEFDQLRLLEERDEVQAAKDLLDKQSAQLQEGIGKLTNGLESLKNQVDEKIAGLSKARAEAVEMLDQKILDRYAAIIRDKNGVAVEEFIDGAGSACGMKPAVLEIDDIHAHAGGVMVCPACRRILVVGKIG